MLLRVQQNAAAAVLRDGWVRLRTLCCCCWLPPHGPTPQ
jgi:hypothetical protein